MISEDNIFSILRNYWGDIIFLLFLILNLTVVYKLLIKKEQKDLNKYAVWTMLTIVGFVLLFAIGIMFSTSEAPIQPFPKEVFRLQLLK